MKMQLIFFFSIFFFFSQILCSKDKNSCELIRENIIKSDKELISLIENNMHILKTNSAVCIDILVNSGKFNALDFYLAELSKRNIKFNESLQMSINNFKKRLEDINDKYRYAEIDYQSVEPAFQWAQSLKNVFLEIKFAHRHDSPGCLEMKNLKVDIKEKEVSLVGFCVLGDVPIKIDFHIDLFKGLNVTNCTHEPGSVGRYKITLEKKEESYWKQLLREGSHQPSNMRVWFELKDKYADELKPFINDEDDKDFEEQLALLGYKKPKPKEKKKKNMNKGTATDESQNKTEEIKENVKNESGNQNK